MIEQEWWKSTFTESYLRAFDSIYSMDLGKQEVEFFTKVLSMKKGLHVLDLACGQGRHAIPLAALGMVVTGIDVSVPLLQAARARASESNVQVSFLEKDVRLYCSPDQYDVAIMLGNSFGYFHDSDNEQVLSNIAQSLKVGGWLVLDLSNVPGMLRKEMVGSWRQDIPDGELTTSVTSFDPETFEILLQWHVRQHSKETSSRGRLRLYTPPEVRRLLFERGLIIRQVFGSLSNEPYSLETRRYIVMAQKQK